MKKIKKIIVVFDTETNGLSYESSVLSISAKKIEVDTELKNMKEIDNYNRFYFINENEEESEKALQINGLTKDVLTVKRNGCKYPKYYKEDKKSFENFCKNVDLIIAHNYDFDSKFIEFKIKSYCTMKDKSSLYLEKNNTTKWIKLKDLAEFFNVELNENNLHGSEYDVLTLSRVLFRMLKLGDKNFLKKLEGDN